MYPITWGNQKDQDYNVVIVINGALHVDIKWLNIIIYTIWLLLISQLSFYKGLYIFSL
jgi:hypothetical protein